MEIGSYRPTSHTHPTECVPVSGASVAQLEAGVITDPILDEESFFPQRPHSAEGEAWMNLWELYIFSDFCNSPVNSRVSLLASYPTHYLDQLKADIQAYHPADIYLPLQPTPIRGIGMPHHEDLVTMHDAGKTIAYSSNIMGQTMCPSFTPVWRRSQLA